MRTSLRNHAVRSREPDGSRLTWASPTTDRNYDQSKAARSLHFATGDPKGDLQS